MLTTHVEVILVVAPLTTHEFKRSKSQVSRRLEPRHEHTHEADGREVLNASHLLLVVTQWNRELVPSGLLCLTITGMDISDLLVGHIIHANLQRVRMNGYAILEIAFILVQRVILVDVLDIRSGARRLILAIAGITLRQRVSFSAVIMLVTVIDGAACIVIIIVAIECVVVTGRVVERRERVFLHRCYSRLGQNSTQLTEEGLVGRMIELIGSR